MCQGHPLTLYESQTRGQFVYLFISNNVVVTCTDFGMRWSQICTVTLNNDQIATLALSWGPSVSCAYTQNLPVKLLRGWYTKQII